MTRRCATAILLAALLETSCGSSIDVLTPPSQCASPGESTTLNSACTRNDECSAMEYCAGDGCGTAGQCRPRCGLCSGTSLECGCDGVTYSSGCGASQAGVRIAGQGVCGAPPGSGNLLDGGVRSCDDDTQCDPGWYCGGQCGAQKTCQFKPTACGNELNPVCSCDGVVYRNGCLATLAGASFDVWPNTSTTPCVPHGR